MRILAMLHLYAPQHNAGAETTAHQLLKKMVERGHQVVVQLSMLHPMYVTGPYTYEGINVYPYVDQGDPIRWLEMADKPDILITHLKDTLRASYLAQQYKIPLVTMMHNDHYKSRMDLRHKTDLVVYNTEWMRSDIESWWRNSLDAEPPRGIVVHPPIFKKDYQISPPPAAKGYITLINLFEEKGSDTFYRLAEAFPRLKFLGVCGAYGKQDIRQAQNVEIIPHVASHLIKDLVYSRTRVLLMPSWYESYGRAAVEASCSGIPTIANPTAGLLEALGAGGTFAAVEDFNAWTAALAGLTTAKGWSEASTKAKGIAAQLTPAEDLERWASAAEQTARIPAYV